MSASLCMFVDESAAVVAQYRLECMTLLAPRRRKQSITLLTDGSGEELKLLTEALELVPHDALAL